MSDEDLQKNPLFIFLQSIPEVFTKAAKQSYVVCVPVKESLKTVKITKDFLLSHVLKQSPYFKEEFMTLNGKVVTLQDGHLLTKQGWVRARHVPILFEELYYDEHFESFRVLHLTYPLEGKVPLAYMTKLREDVTCRTKIERRTITEHTNVIGIILGDIELQKETTQACAQYVTNFNAGYQIVKGFLKDTAANIRASTEKILQNAIHKGGRAKPKDWPSSQQTNELKAAIETIIHAGIERKLMDGLQSLSQNENKFTFDNILELNKTIKSMTDLGVREEIACIPTGAIAKMKQLATSGTPYEKLCCLHDVSVQLSTAVEEERKKAVAASPGDDPGDFVLSADDILPMTVFVMLKAAHTTNPQKLVYDATTLYLEYFLPLVGTSQLEASLANFRGALQYIRQSRSVPQANTEEESPADLGATTEAEQMTLRMQSLFREGITAGTAVKEDTVKTRLRVTSVSSISTFQLDTSPSSTTPTSRHSTTTPSMGRRSSSTSGSFIGNINGSCSSSSGSSSGIGNGVGSCGSNSMHARSQSKSEAPGDLRSQLFERRPTASAAVTIPSRTSAPRYSSPSSSPPSPALSCSSSHTLRHQRSCSSTCSCNSASSSSPIGSPSSSFRPSATCPSSSRQLPATSRSSLQSSSSSGLSRPLSAPTGQLVGSTAARSRGFHLSVQSSDDDDDELGDFLSSLQKTGDVMGSLK